MAVIEPLVYENGTLMSPSIRSINKAKWRIMRNIATKKFPTFDIGFYHMVELRVYGGNDRRAHEAAVPRLRTIFSKLNQVEGLSTIATWKSYDRSSQYGGTYEIWTIIYAIEETGNPNQGVREPYRGYTDDRRNFGFTVETVHDLVNTASADWL